MGKRGPKPKGIVKIKWSSNFAYALGLLATDGSLSINGRHINLTSKDKDQAKTFKKCLGIEHIKIGKKSSGSNEEKKYYQVQFGDILFYEWLLELGMTPNKSKTLSSLKIPDKYFFDFLRGCFDGDGSIYAFWDLRWRSSYMFYISFTGASPLFLQWLQETILRLSTLEGKITKATRAYQLRFAKEGSYALFDKMYYNKNILYLRRKFTKAQKIFTIDRQNKN